MNKAKIFSIIITVVVTTLIFGVTIFNFTNQMKVDLTNLNEKMLIAKIAAESNVINEEFVKIDISLKSVADVISSMDTYDETLLKNVFGKLLKSDDMFLRSGYWFEPEQFQAGEKYHAYYYSRGGDNISTTVALTKAYSNMEYDYLTQDWYTEGMAETGDIFYTPPFFDTAMKLFMMTAEKKFERSGKPIGLVTVDIYLKEMREYLKSIKVGTAGSAFIVTQDGFYMGENTRTRGDLQKKITEETDEDLKALGTSIMMGKFDKLHRIASNKSVAISHPIGVTGLTLVLLYPESEIYGTLNNIVRTNLVIFGGGMILLVGILILIIQLTNRKSLKKKISNPL